MYARTPADLRRRSRDAPRAVCLRAHVCVCMGGLSTANILVVGLSSSSAPKIVNQSESFPGLEWLQDLSYPVQSRRVLPVRARARV